MTTRPPIAPERSRRRIGLPRLSANPETRSVQVGVVATILIHLLLFLVVPKSFQSEFTGALDPNRAASQQFNIELAPDEFQKTPPPPFKFVETNPDAPDNVPDKTENFAAQNQQVAQETPTPEGQSDKPALEGEKDREVTQIVDGQMKEVIDRTPAPAAETPPVQEQPAATVKREQTPLPGFEKKEGDNQEGIGTNVAKFPERAEPVPERVEGQKMVPLIQGATVTTPQIDPRKPQPRPSLVRAPQTRPAVLAENKIGTTNIGLTGIDAKFSNYGQYLQKMIEAVQVQWERIILQSAAYPQPGSTVTVIFRLNSAGEIPAIVSVDGGTSGKQAEQICVSAITDRAPYGKWTDDMVAVLGDSQEMTFTFLYR